MESSSLTIVSLNLPFFGDDGLVLSAHVLCHFDGCEAIRLSDDFRLLGRSLAEALGETNGEFSRWGRSH